MKIIGSRESSESGEKRFYIPGVVIEEDCPKCGKPMKWDGNKEYLMYPTYNAPTKIGLYCVEEDCGGEAIVAIVLRMTVEEA